MRRSSVSGPGNLKLLADQLQGFVKLPAELFQFLREELPDVYAVPQDATYLMWLDVSRFTDDSEALQRMIRKKTGLWVMPGTAYGGDGNRFLRLNIACPESLLKDGLGRLKAALG